VPRSNPISVGIGSPARASVSPRREHKDHESCNSESLEGFHIGSFPYLFCPGRRRGRHRVHDGQRHAIVPIRDPEQVAPVCHARFSGSLSNLPVTDPPVMIVSTVPWVKAPCTSRTSSPPSTRSPSAFTLVVVAVAPDGHGEATLGADAHIPADLQDIAGAMATWVICAASSASSGARPGSSTPISTSMLPATTAAAGRACHPGRRPSLRASRYRKLTAFNVVPPRRCCRRS